MILKREDGRTAGLYDICEWWIETYPSDIFIGLKPETKMLCEIRLIMQNLLLKRKRVIPSDLSLCEGKDK